MLNDIKKRREQELEELIKVGADVIMDETSGTVRLPNRVTKGISVDPKTGTATQGND